MCKNSIKQQTKKSWKICTNCGKKIRFSAPAAANTKIKISQMHCALYLMRKEIYLEMHRQTQQ